MAASPEAVAAAVRRLDLSGSPSVRLLFALRGMPPWCLTLDGLLRAGFFVLEDDPSHTLSLALVGRFWTARGALRRMAPADFARFDEPGHAKAIWRFDWTAVAGGTRLTTETTVVCTDARSRRRFALYWVGIRPFSGWIRRRALAAIAADAERSEREGSR